MKTKQEQIEEMAGIMQKGEIDREKGYIDCSHFSCKTVLKHGMQRLAGATALHNDGYRKASELLERADDLLHDLAMSYAERGHMDFFAVCEEVHHKVIEKLAAEIRQEVENG